MIRTIVAVALVVSATLGSRAQTGLETSHISSTLYFRSDAEEISSRAALHVKVGPEVETLASATVQSLPAELERSEALIAALQTHAAFLKVRTLEDTQDQPGKIARDEVDTDQSVLKAAMDDRLRRLAANDVTSLGRYLFLAQNARREGAKALSPDAE